MAQALEIGDEHEVSRQQEIENPRNTRPHVVILGAGASIAALPNGDKNGRSLPDLRGVAKLPAVLEVLREHGIEPGDDFESLYSGLAADPDRADVCADLEAVVRDFFAAVEIVNEPTIYDHLLMSLRSKDLVATFNWDPLIVQAIRRIQARGFHDLPTFAFLHGNVAIGVCPQHHRLGGLNDRCPDCLERMEPVPLLYPVAEKDYESNDYIASAWELLEHVLGNALFSVFGYRAPVSDKAAILALQEAWGSVEERQLEEVELIVRPGADREVLRERWSPFIHSHHYSVVEDFYESWIARHPRRTMEAFYSQFIMGKFIDDNPVPRDLDLDETIRWYADLASYESDDLPGLKGP